MHKMRKRKKLPVGIDNFSKIREDDFYYVDKTGLIEMLLENWGEVNLFTRPRRFGKSLNMSMLRHFFEIGTAPSLFDGLSISKNQKLCQEFMGRYPVISISLKGVDADNFLYRQFRVPASTVVFYTISNFSISQQCFFVFLS